MKITDRISLHKKLHLFVAFYLIIVSNILGQVSYKVTLDADKITYRVFMKSSASYMGIQAKISTSQVTLVVPHGLGANQFQISNLKGKTAGSNQMNWGFSRVDAPIENPSFDYVSFGFSGSGSSILFDISSNQEIELFNFKNAGTCLGGVSLITNSDPFMPPNASNTNPGNQMTVLGYGSSNAYQNNYGGGVNCQTSSLLPDLTASISGPSSILPNTPLAYNIAISNINAAATTGAINVQTTLPSGLNYNSTSGNGWSSTAQVQPNGSTIVSSVYNGNLPANGNTNGLIINATASSLSPSGTVFNISGGVSGGGETNTSNNAFSMASTLGSATTNTDLALISSLTNNAPLLNENITYRFTLSNLGQNAATNVQSTITLPANFNVLSFNASNGVFNQSNGVWTVNNIPAGQSYTLTVLGRPPSEGLFFAQGQITNSGTQDNNLANNSTQICYSVPVKLCSGANYIIRLPKSLNSIQWFRNNISIPNATTDTLLINTTGNYTYTSSTPCGTNGCCPIVVTTGQVSNNLSITPNTVSNCGSYNLANLVVTLGNTVANSGLSYYANQTDANNGVNPISSLVTQTGTYWVRYKPYNDCASVGSVAVTINSALTFTPPPAICGTSFDLSSVPLFKNGVQLTTGIKYYATVINSSSSVIIFPISNPVVNQTGMYYATYTNPDGCVSLATFNIEINPVPTAPVVSDKVNICPSNSVNLTANLPATSTRGGLYEWHVANDINSAVVPNPSSVGTGNYYVFEKSAKGCVSTGDLVKATVTPCCTTGDCSPFRLVKVKIN